jgi:hypothetical protein
MNKLAGVAVFAATLGVALLVTSYYNPRPRPAPPTVVVVNAPPPPPPPAQRTKVTHKVQLVTLDMEARRSHTTLTVEHEPGANAPEKLWVCTGFFVPGGSEEYPTEPVLVEKPFASGRRATLTVTAACHWCGQRGVPAAGFYANAVVSTISADDALHDHVSGQHKIGDATPVTVEEGRRKSR